jgi:hypothetical protein
MKELIGEEGKILFSFFVLHIFPPFFLPPLLLLSVHSFFFRRETKNKSPWGNIVYAPEDVG